MSGGLERFGISREELEDMIRRDADVNSKLNDFMRNEIVPAWKTLAEPHTNTAAYRASIKVTKKAKRGVGRVGATDFKAHWLEYGTGEPYPTPEYGFAAKIAAKYGGDIKGITVTNAEGGDDE